MEKVHFLSTLFGTSSCITCLGLTIFVISNGKIMISEPNLNILIIELLIAFMGTITNTYTFVKYLYGVKTEVNSRGSNVIEYPWKAKYTRGPS